MDVKDGGILCREGDNLFFEEYNRPPFTRILDGLLFILLAVYDLYDVTGTGSYGEYFKQGCDTLECYLSRWDFDNQWSFYDINRKQLSNPLYHAMNYCLLEALGKVANRPTFRAKAESWQSFIHEPRIETKINQVYFRLLENSSWYFYRDPRNKKTRKAQEV